MALTLPPGWANPAIYTAQKKIEWFNANGVTPDDLASAGVTADEIDWMLANGLNRNPTNEVENKVSASAAQELKTQATQAYATRVEDLAEDLGVPKSVVANYVNQGLSDNEIKAKHTPTADIAKRLIEAAMSTGVADTAATNFNQYGGYDKVLDKYLDSGQTLSLASLTPEQLQSAATKVNETGVGNLNTLAITGTPISQTALNAMTKNGVDPATVAQIARDYSADNIKNTQTKVVQNLVNSTPNINTTDLFSKYVDQAQGYQGTLEGVPGVDFKGSSGLREFYGPYVTDYLSRASALLGMRDAEDYQPMKFGTGYGTETAQTLKDLQTQRANMMGMGTGANATPAYQPYQYSFTPKSAKSGGIMSLIEGYADGGMTGTQVVPTAFDSPDAFSPTTYSSGYTAPSTYKAPTSISAGFQQPATYTPGTISSNYQAPAVYQAGTIGSTYQGTTPYSATNIQSGYQAPGDLYKAGTVSSNYQAPAAYQAGAFTPEKAVSEQFGAAERDQYMSPYTSGVVDPQVREAKRQAEIARQAQAARMTRSGAFGGSRQAIAESELGRNLATQIGDIYGKGQQEAFLNAQQQFERDQARQAAAQQLNIQKGLEAQQLGEQSRQFGAGLGARSAELAAQLGLQAQTATEAAKQAAGQQALSSAQTAGQLGLEAQRAQEQAKQFGAGLTSQEAQTRAQLGLQAQTAQESARQAAGQQALSAAQTAGQLGLEAQRAQEQAKQFGAEIGLRGATTAAQTKLQEQQALEQARQVAGQQGLTAAETAARLGLQGSELTERSKQFGAQYGLQSAQSAAQYEQQARELQQRAEEAQARGDQFGASLALQQLQEAQRAAEASRAFEYQQARDTYLDPYRELGYASQLLQGLPVSAGATGISPATEAIISMLGLGNVLGVGGAPKKP